MAQNGCNVCNDHPMMITNSVWGEQGRSYKFLYMWRKDHLFLMSQGRVLRDWSEKTSFLRLRHGHRTDIPQPAVLTWTQTHTSRAFARISCGFCDFQSLHPFRVDLTGLITMTLKSQSGRLEGSFSVKACITDGLKMNRLSVVLLLLLLVDCW